MQNNSPTYPFMETYSGAYIQMPFDIDINVERDSALFLIEDVAHALSMVCRYGGHSQKFYSVAEHSLRVSYSVPEEYALDGLMHDMTEAYMADIVAPFKPYLVGYREWEAALHRRMASVFGVKAEVPPAVDTVDKAMCSIEIPHVLRSKGEGWLAHRPVLDTSRYPEWMSKDGINFLSHTTAKNMFLNRYKELVK